MTPPRKPSARSQPQPKPLSLARQVAKFMTVGGSNTLIDYTLYIAISNLFQVPLGQVYRVKYISGSVALANSFYWNRRWTFRSHAGVAAAGWKFVATSLVSVYLIQPQVVRLVTTSALGPQLAAHVPAVVSQATIIKTLAFGAGVIASGLWDFTLYKFWAFREVKQ